jgi:hypothetical protein
MPTPEVSARNTVSGVLIQYKNPLLVAAIVLATVVLVAGPAHSYLFKIYCTYMPICHSHPASPSSPDPQQPGSPSHPDGSTGGSAYYQKGYQSAKSGLARQNYGVDEGNTAGHPADMEQDTCSESVTVEVTGADFLQAANQDDYMKGCLQAFQDFPPTGGAKPGPPNPYR